MFRRTKRTWTWSICAVMKKPRRKSAENKPSLSRRWRPTKLRFRNKSKQLSSFVSKRAVSTSASVSKSTRSSSV